MKHIITIILLWVGVSAMAQEKPTVVASASMIADMTHEIAGDLVNIEMIVPIGGDPHIYEPTPSDVRLVHDADLVLINGLTFEGWITELIENSGTEATTTVVTDGVDVLTSLTYKNSADPHAWMDAANGIMYAQNIAKSLITLDPDNASTYNTNLQTYIAKLQDLDSYISRQIKTIPSERRVLITSHDAFQYYGKKYGIRLEAIMGISTDAEAQTSDIIRVGKAIKESGIPAIFVESTINPKLIKQLATDNGIRIGGELYADSLGDKDSPAATYIDMLRHNTDTIVAALKEAKQQAKVEEKSNLKYIWILAGVLLLALLAVIIRANRS